MEELTGKPAKLPWQIEKPGKSASKPPTSFDADASEFEAKLGDNVYGDVEALWEEVIWTERK